jgi:hypothetical protein
LDQQTFPTTDTAAAEAFFYLSRVIPAYTVNLRKTWWNTTDGPWPGDTVMVQVPNLEGNTAGDAQRVLSLTFAIGDDGDEKVGITVGMPPLYSLVALSTRQRTEAAQYRRLMAALFGGSQ